MINRKYEKDGENHGSESELIASSFIYFRENRISRALHISYLTGKRPQLILINQETETYLYYLNSSLLFKATHTIQGKGEYQVMDIVDWLAQHCYICKRLSLLQGTDS